MPFIVDVDDSIGETRPRLRLSIDQDRLEFFGVEQRDVYDTIQTLFGGTSVGYSHRGDGRNPIAIAVRLAEARPRLDRGAGLDAGARPTRCPAARRVVELGDVVQRRSRTARRPIFRHNGRSAEMVTAELAGAFEAPLYGMLDGARRASTPTTGAALPKPVIACTASRRTKSRPTLLWDGEWEVT